jgi:hypothetical protein
MQYQGRRHPSHRIKRTSPSVAVAEALLQEAMLAGTTFESGVAADKVALNPDALVDALHLRGLEVCELFFFLMQTSLTYASGLERKSDIWPVCWVGTPHLAPNSPSYGQVNAHCLRAVASAGVCDHCSTMHLYRSTHSMRHHTICCSVNVHVHHFFARRAFKHADVP